MGSISLYDSDHPSLKALLPQAIAQAYRNAHIEAAAETNLLETVFLAACPWSFDEIVSEHFWPE